MKIRGGAFVLRADLRRSGRMRLCASTAALAGFAAQKTPARREISRKARAGVSLLLCIRRGGFPYRISRTFPLMPDGVVTGGFSIPAIWNRLGKSQASRSSVVATSIRIRFFPG